MISLPPPCPKGLTLSRCCNWRWLCISECAAMATTASCSYVNGAGWGSVTPSLLGLGVAEEQAHGKASLPSLPRWSGKGSGRLVSIFVCSAPSALPPPTAARFGAGAISSNFSTLQNQLGSFQKCRLLCLTPESLIQQV